MKSILQKLGGVLKPASSLDAKVPEGTRVYVVGDIHGRMDLLSTLHEKIENDLQERPVQHSVEIYLGDYVDRGPEPGKVIDTLMEGTPVCDERVCLKGNHEDTLLRFLAGSDEVYRSWKTYGGLETLYSYGVKDMPSEEADDIKACRQKFLEAFPAKQSKFLSNLPLSASVGDYFFAHAGVRPGIALEDQEKRDLLWIREDFLLSREDFGKVVVHGHTPIEEPEIHTNRINIDTCAYATGRLTCLVLEGGDRRFLSTGV